MTTDNKEQQEQPPATLSNEPPPAGGAMTDSDTAAPLAPAAADQPAAALTAKSAGRSNRIYLLSYIAAVPLLVALGALGAWFYFEDRFAALHADRARFEQSIDAFSQRLQAIETKVQPLAGRVEQMTGDVGELKTLTMPTAQLAAKAADIEQRLSRLDQQLAQMAATHLQASDILDRVARLETTAVRGATLDQRVQSLEATGTAAREALMRGSGIVLAVGHLARAVQDSEPFAAQLTTLKVMAGNDTALLAAVKSLEPFAAAGVPTLARLRAEFPTVALAVSRDEGAARGQEWHDRVLNRISSLVTVRRTGPEAIAAGGTPGLLATAEQALTAGELKAAVDAVGKIDGPGAKAAAGWLAEARARLAADQALAALEDRAIVYLSQIKG